MICQSHPFSVDTPYPVEVVSFERNMLAGPHLFQLRHMEMSIKGRITNQSRDIFKYLWFLFGPPHPINSSLLQVVTPIESSAIWWSNFDPIQVKPYTIGQIWNQCKWHSFSRRDLKRKSQYPGSDVPLAMFLR